MNEGTQPVVEKSTAPVAPTSAKPKQKSKALLVIVALVALALVAALVMKYLPGASTDGAKKSTADPKSVVATVNGIDITRAELDKKVAQVKSTIPEGGADPSTDANFEYQLLDEVVNLKLLVATAEAKGFTTSDVDIQKEIDALIQKFGGDAEFQKQLIDNGLTADELRVNMRNELLIRQLIDSETTIKGVTVTDEEIQATYDQATAGATNATDTPPIAQVSEMIKAQLLQKKSAEIVQAYITQLRGGAKIDILL